MYSICVLECDGWSSMQIPFNKSNILGDHCGSSQLLQNDTIMWALLDTNKGRRLKEHMHKCYYCSFLGSYRRFYVLHKIYIFFQVSIYSVTLISTSKYVAEWIYMSYSFLWSPRISHICVIYMQCNW